MTAFRATNAGLPFTVCSIIAKEISVNPGSEADLSWPKSASLSEFTETSDRNRRSGTWRDFIIYTLHMQIMKCRQKLVTIMQGCHANPKFHRLKLWIWRFFLTGSSIHLPCYPLTGAYRHKHPLTLTHTQRTVTKSPFLHMHVSAAGRRSVRRQPMQTRGEQAHSWT